jgi:hypothetical protein
MVKLLGITADPEVLCSMLTASPAFRLSHTRVTM